MIETNIRLFKYGPKLYLDVRRVKVEALQVNAKLLESVCYQLQRHPHRLAAARDVIEGVHHLLVANLKPVQIKGLSIGNWQVDLTEVGTKRLEVSDQLQANALARILERYLLIHLERNTDLWSLGDPRQWYSPESFQEEAGIAAFAGFRVSVIPIEGAGIGAVAHLNTAFFTANPISYFFDPSIPEAEWQRRQGLFNRYQARQPDQKASLLYKLPHRRMTCFLVEFLAGKTCGDTKPPKINNQTYASVYDYYQQTYPELNIQKGDPVALVSFSWSNDVVPVAANLLYMRVMNEAVPQDLAQVDKLKPDERKRETEQFWQKVGMRFLGRELEADFWQPPAERVYTLAFPVPRFGQTKTLDPPSQPDVSAYQAHFRARLPSLKKFGCYYVPPTLERKIIVAHPMALTPDVLAEFVGAVMERLQGWTGKRFDLETLPYTEVGAMIDKLNNRPEGFVIFVLDDTDNAYYLLSAKLKKLRLKRVTAAELREKHTEVTRRPGLWHSFVDLTLLDVLEQLDCVPWGVAPGDLHYNAYLAIDVGEKRRHFALTLLAHNQQLPYWLGGDAYPKPKGDRETIEPDVLSDRIVEVGLSIPPVLRPLTSVLVLRDGRQSGEEATAIQIATEQLIGTRVFTADVRVDVVDFAKSSLREVRLWERADNDRPDNPLEGTVLRLDQNTIVLTTTGRATLHQGTATPLVLTATQDGSDMLTIARDVFALAQLNWANPRVAHRLPHVIRVTDIKLETKMAEETRGLA
jgi:hypothetical protein